MISFGWCWSYKFYWFKIYSTNLKAKMGIVLDFLKYDENLLRSCWKEIFIHNKIILFIHMTWDGMGGNSQNLVRFSSSRWRSWVIRIVPI